MTSVSERSREIIRINNHLKREVAMVRQEIIKLERFTEENPLGAFYPHEEYDRAYDLYENNMRLAKNCIIRAVRTIHHEGFSIEIVNAFINFIVCQMKQILEWLRRAIHNGYLESRGYRRLRPGEQLDLIKLRITLNFLYF